MPGADAILQAGRLLIEAIEAGGLKTLPLPLPQGTITAKKVKTRLDDDCKRVLKLCDAEACVDDQANAPGALDELVSVVLVEILTGGISGQLKSPLGSFAEGAVACMKAKALTQKHRVVRHKAEPGETIAHRIGGVPP